MKYPDNLHTGKLRDGLFSAVKPALNLFAIFIMASVTVPVGTVAAMPAKTNAESGTTPDAVTAPRLSEQQAISAVFNQIETQTDTQGERIVVNNPHHRVSFAHDGVHFSPRRGPDWHWQLATPSKAAQQPAIARQGAVDYIRPGYIERYLLKANTIEQRFILEQPYTAKKDLVIDGAIKSAGQFSTTDTGWRWQDDKGAVNLGQVTVFDANGKILPASMHTTAEHSRITVAANVLHTAAYPVTIDPEIGGDIRLSDMGNDGNNNFDASIPEVAYNSTNNEYLVVWQGDDNTGTLVEGELEIFGQRVDAATGAEIGGDIRLSDMGDDGNASFDAFNPAVAYNATNNEYLVVWTGDDNTGALVNDENEIFGQRVNAATGAEIGGDIRLSDMGDDGSVAFNAFNSAVAYNATNNEYLVVWNGNDNTGTLANNENEVFGQRVNAATGAEIGDNDFRLSDMGDDGNTSFTAFDSAVAYNSTNNEYLVVWTGDDNTGALVEGENEIFGQRVNAATGAEIGDNDFRLSDMGNDGNTNFDADGPAVAYNAANNEYLVVWTGDDNTGALVNDENEIFGQRVNAATGAEIGDNDFRLSDMGNDGNASFDANAPVVAYNAANNEYLVVWQGDDNTGALVEGENEIFGQRVNAATGAEIGDNDFRLSDMGNDGNANFDASSPAVAYNAANNEYLPVWVGDDNSGALVEGEFEVFAQRFAGPATLRFAHAAINAAENSGTVLIEVQRVGDTDDDVLVDFDTSDGTATTPADYTTASGTLSFLNGETSKTFEVSLIDNAEEDGDKTVNLTLSNPQIDGIEVTLDAQASLAVLTIEDDEVPNVNGGDGDGDNDNGGGSSGGSLNPILLMLLFSTWLAGRWINHRRYAF